MNVFASYIRLKSGPLCNMGQYFLIQECKLVKDLFLVLSQYKAESPVLTVQDKDQVNTSQV